MVNLLRLVRAFVEDETRRDAFRADPSTLIAETDGDLSGEDVEAALDVVRTQVAPELADRLHPDDGDLRFPRLTPADNEVPLTVALRCLRWIDRRLGNDADPADAEFETLLLDLTGYEPPPPPPRPEPAPPADASDDTPPVTVADGTADEPRAPDGYRSDDDGSAAVPLLAIDGDTTDEPHDETTAAEPVDIDDATLDPDDPDDSDDSDVVDAAPAAQNEVDGDDDASVLRATGFDEDEATESELVEPASMPEADADDAEPEAEASEPEPAEARSGRSLFGGGAAMKLPFAGDVGPMELPFAGDAAAMELPFGGGQDDLPFAPGDSGDDDDVGRDHVDPTTRESDPDVTDETVVEPPAEPVPDRVDDALATDVPIDPPLFRTLEVVVLPLGIPEVDVPAGAEATVVAVHLEPTLHYEIEVDDGEGTPTFFGTVTPETLAKLPR